MRGSSESVVFRAYEDGSVLVMRLVRALLS